MKKIYTLLYYLQHLLPQSTDKRNTLINYQLSTINYPLILFFALLILIPGCKCKKDCDDAWNPDCSNYDPCYGVEETSADFICYAAPLFTHDDSFRATLAITDSIYCRSILLEPKYECDSLKWKIGLEPEYRTSKSCYVSFGNKIEDRVGTIDVTCIAYRQPSASCHPDDDGIDTVTRPIHIMRVSDAPIFGVYRGKFITEDYFTDSFDITIRYDSAFGLENIFLDSIDRDLPQSQITNVSGYTKDRLLMGGGIFQIHIKNKRLDITITDLWRSYYYRTLTGDTSRSSFRHWAGHKL